MGTDRNIWTSGILEATRSFPSRFPKEHWKNIRLGLLLSIDAVWIIISLYASYVLRLESFDLGNFRESFWSVASIYVFFHICVFVALKMNNQVWRYANFNSGLFIAKCTLIATALAVTFCYIFPMTVRPPRSIPIIFWFIATSAICFVKFTWRWVTTFEISHENAGLSRCFIYGAGTAGELLARHIKSTPKFGFNVAGFIDDDLSKKRHLIHGRPILGGGKDLKRLSAEHGVDTVLIAMHSVPGKIVRDIVKNCHESALKPLIMPEIATTMNEEVFRPRKIDVSDLLRRSPKSMERSKVASFFREKTVLITGAGGSIGSELSRQILKLGPKKILLLDVSEFNLYQIENELRASPVKIELEVLMGSVSDKQFVINVFEQYHPHIVFHAAAYKHVPLVEANPIQGVVNNFYGTQIVAEEAQRQGVEHFLLISSDKAVNPVGVMGQTKRVCELVVQSLHFKNPNGCKFSAVRFGNVLGSSGSVIPKFIQQISQGGPVTVTDPAMTRFFMLVQEAVELVLQSITMTKGGEVFVLNMGDSVNIYEMAKQLIGLAGKRVGEDIDVVFTGVRNGEKLYEELIYTGFEDQTDHDDIFITKTRRFDLIEMNRMFQKLKDACTNSDVASVRKVLNSLCSEPKPSAEPPLNFQGSSATFDGPRA